MDSTKKTWLVAVVNTPEVSSYMGSVWNAEVDYLC